MKSGYILRRRISATRYALPRKMISLTQHHVNIFRSREPDLIHVFHDKDCTGLVGVQLTQCDNTRASHRMSLYKYAEKLQTHFSSNAAAEDRSVGYL